MTRGAISYKLAFLPTGSMAWWEIVVRTLEYPFVL